MLGRDAHAFLLESVVGGEKIGRYSFIATGPSLVYQVSGGDAVILEPGRSGRKRVRHDRPAGRPAEAAAARPLSSRTRTCRPSPAGWSATPGTTRSATTRREKLHLDPPKDDRRLPDLLFGLYNELVIFDHVDKTIKVVANATVTEAQRPRNRNRLTAMPAGGSTRSCSGFSSRRRALGEIDPPRPLTLPFTSNFTREQFEDAVRKGQEYIKAGDIFQFVPSQRLRVPSEADPFDVYRALRIINPSPFMFFLKSPRCTLIGSSPEILCRVQDGEGDQPAAGRHAPAGRDAGGR